MTLLFVLPSLTFRCSWSLLCFIIWFLTEGTKPSLPVMMISSGNSYIDSTEEIPTTVMNFKRDTAATNVFLICSFFPPSFLGGGAGHSGSSSSVSSYPSILLCNVNMHVLLHYVWKHLSGIFTLPRLHVCKPFLTSRTPSFPPRTPF